MNTSAKIEEAAREVISLELRLKQAEHDRDSFQTRLREVLDTDNRMLLIRLDGSTQQKAVYAGADGQPVRTYREAYIHPMPATYWDRDPRGIAPSHTRTFRLMGQVGKLFIYGEV